MMKKNDKLLDDARTTLNRRAEELDDSVVAKLRAARMRATEAADRQRDAGSWISRVAGAGQSLALSRMTGSLAAASMVLAVAVTVWLANPVAPRNNLEDLEILAASEAPEFYQDLEFYFWLDERQTRAG